MPSALLQQMQPSQHCKDAGCVYLNTDIIVRALHQELAAPNVAGTEPFS